jgi:hypothetical protein
MVLHVIVAKIMLPHLSPWTRYHPIVCQNMSKKELSAVKPMRLRVLSLISPFLPRNTRRYSAKTCSAVLHLQTFCTTAGRQAPNAWFLVSNLRSCCIRRRDYPPRCLGEISHHAKLAKGIKIKKGDVFANVMHSNQRPWDRA